MASDAKLGSFDTLHPMRITLPISVACDLEKFQRAIANVAELVGRDGWAPAVGPTVLQGREFLVDPASLQAREGGRH